jgi:hypothetical protein
MITWETMYALIIFGPLQYSSASSRQAAYLGPSSECVGLVAVCVNFGGSKQLYEPSSDAQFGVSALRTMTWCWRAYNLTLRLHSSDVKLKLIGLII